jgi:hypothetical protein
VFRDSLLVIQMPRGPDANLLEQARARLVSTQVWAGQAKLGSLLFMFSSFLFTVNLGNLYKIVENGKIMRPILLDF